ncbi:MAG: terpene cyclase/mutase family protein [Deferrisomatales bacterium]|nr:terpene cyclase/mutase family protein [Deferrisomatales bacterium]
MRTLAQLVPALLLLFTFPFVSLGTEDSRVFSQSKQDASLRYEVEHAIDKGLKWLDGKQNPDGSWSQPEYPALTALVLKAYMGEPMGNYRARRPAVVENGYRYLLASVQPDGGIYSSAAPRPMENYNTAVSMVALILARDPGLEPVILKARNYLVSLQNNGGVGYNKSGSSDLSNTVMALEALYYSKHLVGDVARKGLDPVKKLDWQSAIDFIQRCQNLPEHNPEAWASDDPKNKGGFVYSPGESKAGKDGSETGDNVPLRSYGSMTYAGLLSYIYADLDKEDPRVTAAYAWLRDNYTLDENPGMGAQGLFYYYHTMAKALSAYGVDRLPVPGRPEADWRRELALRLLSLQDGEEGSWVNENGRWWERDPVLVTSYALIALEIVYRGL